MTRDNHLNPVYRCPKGGLHTFSKKKVTAITWIHGIPWITRKVRCTKCRGLFPKGISAE